jgi:hypothetical protein
MNYLFDQKSNYLLVEKVNNSIHICHRILHIMIGDLIVTVDTNYGIKAKYVAKNIAFKIFFIIFK